VALALSLNEFIPPSRQMAANRLIRSLIANVPGLFDRDGERLTTSDHSAPS
jgi:hypothetical protein